MYHMEWQKNMYSVGPLALHGVISAYHVRGQIGSVTEMDGSKYRDLLGAEKVINFYSRNYDHTLG